jgi:hypothetical protein
MTDQQHDSTRGPSADETFAWSAEQDTASGSPQAREWMTQLQAMIENLTTQARPVIREIGIKAAELAVAAGEKAGPVAQRAAEITGQAGQKLAERSRDFAADLRSQQAAAKDGGETDVTDDTSGAEGKPTADVA